ncbi:MAG: asparagine synthetase B, partial [Firmicutes bacterium]|nr:asparagine synthetase B [Bacillota bacterium]
MLTRMAHRGPDGEGKFFEQGVSLGMRRLAVMDVAGGGQPYRSEDGRVVAVFNGEIYNYPELAGTVSDHGHRLISRADGEVLVHLYEMYGSDMVTHLRGMFAFALWDSRHQRLLLARDHVGQKPLD